ncbi:MAG: hypothetical protein KBT12_02245 [Bacteroidales bacterium]|nr:hypothetical protein [Candidatus Physcousia equi]
MKEKSSFFSIFFAKLLHISEKSTNFAAQLRKRGQKVRFRASAVAKTLP